MSINAVDPLTPVGKPIDYEFLTWLESVKRLQKRFAPFELSLRRLLVQIISSRGIAVYAVRRTEKGYENADEMFTHIKPLLIEAQEIRIAVGEMGHQLFENMELLESLQYAFDRNQARIEIVHGPRVDPYTRHIHQLEDKGIVSLYRTAYYIPHHFFLVRNRIGQVSAIDESTHYETLWAKDALGHLFALFEDDVRLYYIINQSTRRVRQLAREFEKRKGLAERVSEHPEIFPVQAYAVSSIVLKLFKYLPMKFVLQPLAILFDLPIDLLLENLYRRIRRGSQLERSHSFFATGLEVKPIKLVVKSIMKGPECALINSKYKEALDKGEITKVVSIGRVWTRGKPSKEQYRCSVCGDGALVYSRGPLESLSNGRLLLVSDIWAYRCDNPTCQTGQSPLIILSEVRDELIQRIIAETSPEPVTSPR